MKKRILSLILSLILMIIAIPSTALANVSINNLSSKEVLNGYTVEFQVISDWKSGYTGQIKITNTGTSTIESWALAFDYEYEITNSWSAKIVEHEDNHYLFKCLEWNADIKPGKSIIIGFSGNNGNIKACPTNYDLCNELTIRPVQDYSFSNRVICAWTAGYNSEIAIKNLSSTIIEDWVLEFDYDNTINTFWTAQIVSHVGNHYVIKNAGSNTNIGVGKTLKLGFLGVGNSKNLLRNIVIKNITINEGKLVEAPVLAIDKMDNGLNLKWNMVKNCSKYTLMRKIGQNEYIEVASDAVLNEYSDIDFETYGIYKYKVIAYNKKGEFLESNEVSGYASEWGYGELASDKIDTDQDGLIDVTECSLGTDPLNADTDVDGLLDGDEINISFTDPLNGDTDGDSLLDSDEIHIYSTSPLKADTDGDRLDDGDEIALGLNPLIQDTDGNGILDNDEKILQILSIEIKESSKPEITEVSVEMSGTGNLNTNTTIESVFGIDMLSSEVVGLIGVPVEINSSSQFDEATITFHYDDKILGSTNEEDLAVMWFDEDNNYYEIFDEGSIIDTVNNTVSYKTTHFSTYLIVDKQKWYDVWRKSISYGRPTIPGVPTTSFDFSYVLDNSGSMTGTNITTAKEAVNSFIDAMYPTDRGSLVTFNSVGTLLQAFTTNKVVLKNGVNSIIANGGTNVNDGLIKSIELFENNPSGNLKVIILLCDGDVNATSETIQRAKNNHIKIYPVLIGSTSGRAALEYIATETGGTFYYAATAADIIDAFYGLNDEIVGEIDTTDTDGDGLYDIYEIAGMMISNGKIIYTDPIKSDSDSDGLSDGFEIGELVQRTFQITGGIEIKSQYFTYTSDPTKKDTDGDGYKDDIDPRARISDVKIVALSNSGNFVKVLDDKISYYGGDQEWFSKSLAKSGGCGTVAATNMFAYMADTNVDYKDLYKYADYSKSNYILQMNDVYTFVKPYSIPLTSIPFGVWPMSKFESGARKYAQSCGVELKAVRFSSPFNKQSITEYIESGLKRDLPIAMLIGKNSKFENTKIYETDGTTWMQKVFELHWVTITEIKIDKIANVTTLKVSTWGAHAYLDLDRYIDGEELYQCLLYFE